MKKLSFLMTLSMMLVSFWGFSQQLTITGNVADDNSLALPGATVLVEGTSNGVTTDFDGNYSIVANVGDVLVFSYVGFDTQTVTVGRDTKINILLNSSNELDEVVVTGITTRNLKRSTSSNWGWLYAYASRYPDHENIKRIKKWSENKSELNKYQSDIVYHYQNIGNLPFGFATWSVVEPNCHSVKK